MEEEEAHTAQYQHFIPQFLLRNFAHKYVSPDKRKAGKPKKHGRQKKKKQLYHGDLAVNSLCLSDGFSLDECSPKRVCGLENMYEGVAMPVKDHGHLEKKFGALENKASVLYRKIIKAHDEGKPDIWLKRAEKDVLRKFMILLTSRGVQYHRKFNLDSMQDYHEDDEEPLRRYMARHGFTKPIDVWLQSLEAIIDLDIDAQGEWQERIRKSIYFPIAAWFIDQISDMYMAICTPANHDEEFILTDTCYNVTEGQTTAYHDAQTGKQLSLSPRFHRFMPISPRLAIVLRSVYLPEPLGDADPEHRWWRQLQRHLMIDSRFGRGTTSILEDLPVQKARTNYMEVANDRLGPRSGWDRRLSMDDSFCFTFFPIHTRHAHAINGLLIDHAFHGSRIIFDRKDVFLDLMEWYLTEPCEVGKNLLGEHRAEHLRYIEGLADFMTRQGRKVSARWTFWPSVDRDLERFHHQNNAAARLWEELSHATDETRSPDFIEAYEKLGGTLATLDEDTSMAMLMQEIWIRCVDLDWDSPEYESICRAKLACLLDGYQQQPCATFWLFLKWIRSNRAKPRSGSASFTSLLENGGNRGPEDMVAYEYPAVQGHELNRKMYEAFHEGKGLTDRLESVGYFALTGDERWRIPTPFSAQWYQRKNEGAGDGPVDVEKMVRSPLLSAQSPDWNQQCDYNEMIDTEEVAEMEEMLRASNATRSWPFDFVEQTTPWDDGMVEDEADRKETAYCSHDEFLEACKRAEEAYQRELYKREMAELAKGAWYVFCAMAAFSLLSCCSYLLAYLLYFFAWLLDLLAWVVWHAMARMLFDVALVVFCLGLMAGFAHLTDLEPRTMALAKGLFVVGALSLRAYGIYLFYFRA